MKLFMTSCIYSKHVCNILQSRILLNRIFVYSFQNWQRHFTNNVSPLQKYYMQSCTDPFVFSTVIRNYSVYVNALLGKNCYLHLNQNNDYAKTSICKFSVLYKSRPVSYFPQQQNLLLVSRHVSGRSRENVSKFLGKTKVQKKKRILSDSEVPTVEDGQVIAEGDSTVFATTAAAVAITGREVPVQHDFLTYDPGLALPFTPTFSKHKPDFEVSAYATSDAIDLDELLKGFRELGLYARSSHHLANENNASVYWNREHTDGCSDTTVEADCAVQGFSSSTHLFNDELHVIPGLSEVLHVVCQYKVSMEDREIYFFRNGSAVFWNVNELERNKVLTYLKRFTIGDIVNKTTLEEQSDSYPYTYSTEGKTRLSGERILLCKDGPTHLERYTFSNALALSVKLGAWESDLDHYIDSIENVAEELQRGGHIILKKEEVMEHIGQVYGLQHCLTLSSDLLAPPDFYWDRPLLEQLYKRTARNLCIEKRTEVMMLKLNNCKQLLELLNDLHGEEKGHRLEMIIIYLILIEVIFGIIHFIIMFYQESQRESESKVLIDFLEKYTTNSVNNSV